MRRKRGKNALKKGKNVRNEIGTRSKRDTTLHNLRAVRDKRQGIIP